MSKILMSIKREYVKKILSGEKCYEYRKTLPKKDLRPVVPRLSITFASLPLKRRRQNGPRPVLKWPTSRSSSVHLRAASLMRQLYKAFCKKQSKRVPPPLPATISA